MAASEEHAGGEEGEVEDGITVTEEIGVREESAEEGTAAEERRVVEEVTVTEEITVTEEAAEEVPAEAAPAPVEVEAPVPEPVAGEVPAPVEAEAEAPVPVLSAGEMDAVSHMMEDGRWDEVAEIGAPAVGQLVQACLLYTSDAVDDLLCVALGGSRIIKKKKRNNITNDHERG